LGRMRRRFNRRYSRRGAVDGIAECKRETPPDGGRIEREAVVFVCRRDAMFGGAEGE